MLACSARSGACAVLGSTWDGGFEELRQHLILKVSTTQCAKLDRGNGHVELLVASAVSPLCCALPWHIELTGIDKMWVVAPETTDGASKVIRVIVDIGLRIVASPALHQHQIHPFRNSHMLAIGAMAACRSEFLAIQVSPAVPQSLRSLFRRNVALRFCHHLISNQELPHTGAA